MNIEPIRVDAFVIHDADHLDPITVVLQDFAPSKGQLLVSVWGESWTATWSAMSGMTIADFLVSCDPGYVRLALQRGRPRGLLRREEAYLDRIVAAMLAGLRQRSIEAIAA